MITKQAMDRANELFREAEALALESNAKGREAKRLMDESYQLSSQASAKRSAAQNALLDKVPLTRTEF